MSLAGTFESSATSAPPRLPRERRAAPFSLRLSEAERERLIAEANGVALGAFIKARLFDRHVPSDTTRRVRRSTAVKDEAALAQALALLGSSHMASNLNQLARAANLGILPVTPETEASLVEAAETVRELRRLLMRALGFRSERGSA